MQNMIAQQGGNTVAAVHTDVRKELAPIKNEVCKLQGKIGSVSKEQEELKQTSEAFQKETNAADKDLQESVGGRGKAAGSWYG